MVWSKNSPFRETNRREASKAVFPLTSPTNPKWRSKWRPTPCAPHPSRAQPGGESGGMKGNESHMHHTLLRLSLMRKEIRYEVMRWDPSLVSSWEEPRSCGSPVFRRQEPISLILVFISSFMVTLKLSQMAIHENFNTFYLFPSK